MNEMNNSIIKFSCNSRIILDKNIYNMKSRKDPKIIVFLRYNCTQRNGPTSLQGRSLFISRLRVVQLFWCFTQNLYLDLSPYFQFLKNIYSEYYPWGGGGYFNI